MLAVFFYKNVLPVEGIELWYNNVMKKILYISGTLAILAGISMIIVSLWAINFTYTNVARENITTSDDASIPNKLVRGPFTLKAQADVIRNHTLNRTDGLTYAEMPRQVPKLNENGNEMFDQNGEVVMMTNEARTIWITATTLMTALNLAIVTYAFSTLVLFFGLVSFWTGITFYILAKKH